MPSSEHEQQQLGEEKRSEPQPVSYYRAARFLNEQQSGRAYFRIQRLLYQTLDLDLSCLRFQLNRIFHVAAFGEVPPADVDRKLRNLLSAGITATLPDEILTKMAQRRAQASDLAPWVERHFDPGERL